MKLTAKQLKQVCQDKGYQWHTPFICGVRSNSLLTDEWNDIIGVCFTDDFGNDVNLMFRASTKLGLNKLKAGNQVVETNVLVPGQYLDCWKIKDKIGAIQLVPVEGRSFSVWKDYDCNSPKFDFTGQIEMTEQVVLCACDWMFELDEYQGAQVIANLHDFKCLVEVLFKNMEKGENLFSYTLFEDRDFIAV